MELKQKIKQRFLLGLLGVSVIVSSGCATVKPVVLPVPEEHFFEIEKGSKIEKDDQSYITEEPGYFISEFVLEELSVINKEIGTK